jgi:pyridoxal phosphate enzyme (YggS family)
VSIDDRLTRVRDRIVAAGGDPERITVLAVTKGHPATVVEQAVASGLADLGESYAQELVAKAEAVQEPVRWHFIGGLQRNKVRSIAPFVHLWQSVDRHSLAAEIARRAPGAAVLVQVNVSGLEHQSGCAPAQVSSVVEGCTDLGLEVRGLMAIGPQGPDDVVRAAFRQVRDLADRFGLPERSMGMSGDLEAAVAEGSTMVRIGTDLFGPRSGGPGVGK